MTVEILQGECLDILPTLPAASVHCCVTSPPYWGLRDYADPRQTGREKTPTEYVERLVDVFREVRRVLVDEGTLWLNLGDCYYGSWQNYGGGARGAGKQRPIVKGSSVRNPVWDGLEDYRPAATQPHETLKPKDLVGIPWRVAFALQADGWWLRGDHVWGKPNGMPESVVDRPTRSHEYVFLLAKSERYWYDAEPVRTAPKASTITRLAQDVENQTGGNRANAGGKTNGTMKAVRRTDKQRGGHTRRHAGFNDRWDHMYKDAQMADGANLRSIWWIPPAQCKDAHFAVMPERVAQICILAGCPEGGTVLDPFLGSGTTALVAQKNGCNCIGIELNAEYVKLAKRRIQQRMLL